MYTARKSDAASLPEEKLNSSHRSENQGMKKVLTLLRKSLS
jgi:hypothetical protein